MSNWIGESDHHIRLVDQLVKWIHDNLKIEVIDFVLKDSPASKEKPPNINGYIPDVYATNNSRERIVIGEAKSSSDLESRNTKSQLDALVEYCCSRSNITIVLAVPWDKVRLAKSLLRNIKKKYNCQTDSIVIDNLSA